MRKKIELFVKKELRYVLKHSSFTLVAFNQ
jgi:hypothetical protein